MYWNKAWKLWTSRSIRNGMGWILIDSPHNIWKFHLNPFINVGGVSCTRKFGQFLDNEGERTFDWAVRFKHKKRHTLLHIIVNNIWKFHWNPFINVGVSRTRLWMDRCPPDCPGVSYRWWPKEHFCEIISKSVQPFRRNCFKGYSIFNSGGYLLHWSWIVWAILVEPPMEHSCEIISKSTPCPPPPFWRRKVFLLLPLVAILSSRGEQFEQFWFRVIQGTCL